MARKNAILQVLYIIWNGTGGGFYITPIPSFVPGLTAAVVTCACPIAGVLGAHVTRTYGYGLVHYGG
jgi:hypothetical protein